MRERVQASKQNFIDINLSSICSELKKMTTQSLLLFLLTTGSSSSVNHSDFQAIDVKDETFNTHDKEFLSLLEQPADIDYSLHLQNKNIKDRHLVTFVQALFLT